MASTDRPLREPGPSQAKNAGGFKRDSQEDVQLLQSSDRKAQHKAWRHWALCSEETRPGATRAQNRLNWQQMRERIPAPLASTPMYTELFQHTPPQHIQHILENIHFLTKGGKIGKKPVASAHTAQAGSKPFGATNYSNKATMLSFPLTLSSPSIPKAGIS